MKKYSGKKEWTETPYYAEEYDYDTFQYTGEGGFFLPWPEFSDTDDFGFRDINFFDDQNDFITYTEIFNIYQNGKI